MNDAHMSGAPGTSVLFGACAAGSITLVRESESESEVEVGIAVEAGKGRRPVTEPSLCRAIRCEAPSLAHLVLSLALVLFAVAISVL